MEYINENIIRIYFEDSWKIGIDNFIRYYILLAKVDEVNNKESFSDKCHLANLLLNQKL